MVANLFKYYVQKHLHLAVCLILFYIFQANTLEYSPDVTYIFFLFFSVISVYNLHAIPRGQPWIIYTKSSPVLLISLSGLFVGFLFLSARVQAFILPVAIITLLYISPVFSQNRKLRDYPFIKIFILSFVLTIMVVTLPGWLHHVDTMVLGLMTASRFIFFFTLCLLFDIRDFDKDQRYGMQTFATSFSLRNLKFAGIFLSVIVLITEIYLANHFIVDLENMVAMALACMAIALYFSRITIKSRTILFSFLCDGIIALPFLVEYVI